MSSDDETDDIDTSTSTLPLTSTTISDVPSTSSPEFHLAKNIIINKIDSTIGISCNLQHQGIRDDDLPNIVRTIEHIGLTLSQYKSNESNKTSNSSIPSSSTMAISTLLIPINLSLEMNFISDTGLQFLLQTFLQWNTNTNSSNTATSTTNITQYYHLRRLRLHMNKISNQGCIYLSNYL